MPDNLKGRSYLTLKDFSPEEIRYLLDLSHDLKRKKRAGIPGDLLRGRNIVLLFEKTSTRTRCAFETACWDEGGNATFLSNSQMGKKESLEDTAKVLGRFYDGIEFRGFAQQTAGGPGQAFRRPGVERADRPLSPHPGAGGHHDTGGACHKAPEAVQAGLCGGRAQQRG